MVENYDVAKMVEIARMHYVDGQKQETIGKEFGVSRSTVSLMLAEAKRLGIVQINIHDPNLNNEEVAGKIEKLFGVNKCIVVPTGVREEKALLKIVASQAASYVKGIMRSHSSIGVFHGLSCSEFMRTFPKDANVCDVDVVPLIGGLSGSMEKHNMQESISSFAEKVQGHAVPIFAPGMVESLQDKQHILSSMYMNAILEKWKNLDCAVLGIGGPPEFYSEIPQVVTLDSLIDKVNKIPDRAIGNIAGQYFNIKGEILDSDYNKKLIAIGEEDLRNANNIVGIACCEYKVLSSIAILISGMLTCFVTDERNANMILHLMEDKRITALGDMF